MAPVRVFAIGDAVENEIERPLPRSVREKSAPYPLLIREIDENANTRKYRGEGLVSAAAGPDFRTAMIQATITGLDKDDLADEKN